MSRFNHNVERYCFKMFKSFSNEVCERNIPRVLFLRVFPFNWATSTAIKRECTWRWSVCAGAEVIRDFSGRPDFYFSASKPQSATTVALTTVNVNHFINNMLIPSKTNAQIGKYFGLELIENLLCLNIWCVLYGKYFNKNFRFIHSVYVKSHCQ